MTKICHFLTALILTTAALATPSAFGYASFVRDAANNAYGFAVNEDSPEDALNVATQLCRSRGGTESGCTADSDNHNNRCFAVYWGPRFEGLAAQLSEPPVIHFNSSENLNLAIQSYENICNIYKPNTPTSVDFLVAMNITCDLIDHLDTDRCDATCNGDNVPRDNSHERGGCQPATTDTHCQIAAARDGNSKMFINDEMDACREAMACSEDDMIPNGSGKCMECGDGNMADSDNTACIPIPVMIEAPMPVTVTNNMEVTLTMHTIRTSENIITVTATDGEEFAVTTTSGSAVTITASSGEIFVVNNQGSASGEPGGETPQSGGISTIEHKADNEKTAVIAAGIGLGVGAVALALYYFIDSPDKIIYEPSYAFQNNNGNLSYSLGNRWTATADNWRFYWQAKQNDKFVYGSGIGYNNGLLSAAINSQSEKDKTDLDVQLSANKTVGLWNLGGGYNFDMQLSETDTETQNRMNATIRYTVDKWILSANANTDGKKAAARINYSYRF